MYSANVIPRDSQGLIDPAGSEAGNGTRFLKSEKGENTKVKLRSRPAGNKKKIGRAHV